MKNTSLVNAAISDTAVLMRLDKTHVHIQDYLQTVHHKKRLYSTLPSQLVAVVMEIIIIFIPLGKLIII